MKTPLLFFSLLGLLTACQHENEVRPSSPSLVDEIVGVYRTNVYLDPSRVAIPADQMPYTELNAESDSSVRLTYINLYPVKSSLSIEHIQVSRQANGVQLRLDNASIGTLQSDRIFTNSGMEKQGQLLRLTVQDAPQTTLYFAGAR